MTSSAHPSSRHACMCSIPYYSSKYSQYSGYQPDCSQSTMPAILYEPPLPEKAARHAWTSCLFPIPHASDFSPPHLGLQLENAIQESLCSWWTPRDVYIHWHNTVHAPDHRVAVVVVSAPIGATAHAYHPFWIRHLVVALAHCRRHLVRNGPGDDHHVSLAGRRSEDDAQPVLVVSRHGGVHHLDAAAG